MISPARSHPTPRRGQTLARRPGRPAVCGILGVWLAAVLLAAPASAQQGGYRILGQADFCDATVMEGPNPRGASSAAPQGRGVILYDPDVMAGLPYLRPFVMAHECAHHALGHTSPAGLLREGHEFYNKELDADCWAAEELIRAGKTSIVTRQIEIFQARTDAGPGPRYPTWRARAKRMQRCADEIGQVAPVKD